MVATYTAKTLSKFIERIRQIRAEWEDKDGEPNLWFRGSQSASWRLVPKLYRSKARAKKLLEDEDEIREEFVRRAPSLTTYNPRNAWEWYFLMQHYSAPTRLLDWTEDPQIALYFALMESEGYQDGSPEIMTAREVKSHSSIDRFLVVFHPPTGMAEPGLLARRSEKTGRAAKCSANTNNFLRSGLTMNTTNCRGFRAIFGKQLSDFSALQTVWRSRQSGANSSLLKFPGNRENNREF